MHEAHDHVSVERVLLPVYHVETKIANVPIVIQDVIVDLVL